MYFKLLLHADSNVMLYNVLLVQSSHGYYLIF